MTYFISIIRRNKAHFEILKQLYMLRHMQEYKYVASYVIRKKAGINNR